MSISLRTIKKLNSDQLFELQKQICDELVKKIQKEYDDYYYPIKNPKDKLKCKICGGSYSRQKKSTHDKTNRHKNRLNEIYEQTCEVF